MLKRMTLTAIALLMLFAVSPQATAIPGGGGNTHRVRADLQGGGAASGKAKYRERTRNNILEQRFSVEVEDAEPGAMMQIHVNDLLVGTIVIDDFGTGELQYRTPAFIDDPGDGDPIPDGFPTLFAGDSITVGPLAGQFEEN